MYSDKLLSSYKKLVNCLKESPHLDPQVIRDLKNSFKSQIDSPRTLDNIKSLSDLISILDKRDELNPVNVNCLRVILERPELISYKLLLINHIREINQHIQANPQMLPCENSTGFVAFSDHLLPPEAEEVLTSALGDSWKSFARHINVDEQDIDALETIDFSVEQKIHQVLKIFLEGGGTCKRGSLLNALSLIKRNDIKVKLEKIFMNSCVEHAGMLTSSNPVSKANALPNNNREGNEETKD